MPRRPIFLLTLLCAVSSAFAEVPPRPEFGIVDDASLFPLQILKATEKILSEHEQLTQERISVLTLSEISGDALKTRAREFFEAWRVDAPRPPNSLVIAISSSAGDIEIVTGLGIDPVLPTTKIAEIRRNYFRPEWENEKRSRAIVLALVETLRTLESPLISSGEAIDAYERAGFSGGWAPVAPRKKNSTGWIWAAAGVLFFAWVLQKVMVAEVHYTASGWDRIPAWQGIRRVFRRRCRGPSLVTGGGVSGKY